MAIYYTVSAAGMLKIAAQFEDKTGIVVADIYTAFAKEASSLAEKRADMEHNSLTAEIPARKPRAGSLNLLSWTKRTLTPKNLTQRNLRIESVLLSNNDGEGAAICYAEAAPSDFEKARQ